ncbi:uncharacterized protein KD926_002071 [Aspergillus affinis]|uniref:uncharacterized protein n=1 Tax=Aspergillus affinis TaxID=1070780 RepID=UPI0022FF151E|nr:uncharacterized protein KD926_002071 [Aspergillus affinis]KAI9036308.1 hypothetical protein KD926_002071 [Aspergillus affinis]
MHNYNVDANAADAAVLPSSLEEQIGYTFTTQLGNYNISLQEFRSSCPDIVKIKYSVSDQYGRNLRRRAGLGDIEGEVKDQKKPLLDVISNEIRKETEWTMPEFMEFNKESEEGGRVLKHIIEAIPGLQPDIVDYLDRRLSMRPSTLLDSDSFQILNRQVSKNFLENTDPSTFLVGIGIRLAISTQVVAITINFLDSYHVMEDMHHTIRGVRISEISVTAVLMQLALYALEQENHASRESTEFTRRHLARLCVPKDYAPVCTATEYIHNYGKRRLAGVSHEVACGLVLPRKVQATFFLEDLNSLLKETREVCWVCFHGSQSELQKILLELIQQLINTYLTLAGEWLRPKSDMTHSSELFSNFGQVFMLSGYLSNGDANLFKYAINFIIQGADNVLGGIKPELARSMLYVNAAAVRLSVGQVIPANIASNKKEKTLSKSASSHIPLDLTSSCVGEAVSLEPLHENSMNGDNSLRSTPKTANFIREDQDRGIDDSMDCQRVYTLGSIVFDTSASLQQGITIVPIEAHMADSDMHPSGQATFKLTDKTAIELAKMHKYIYSQQSLLYGGEWYSDIRQQELDHLNGQFATALKNLYYNIDYEALGTKYHKASADTCSRVESLISAMLYSRYALRFGLWAFLSDFI